MPHEHAPKKSPLKSGPKTRTSHGVKFIAVHRVGASSYWRVATNKKSPAKKSPAKRVKNIKIISPCAPGMVHYNRKDGATGCRKSPTKKPKVSPKNTKLISPCAPGMVHYNRKDGATGCRKSPKRK